jgi:N-acetylmuramoyl-L-alanine amidase
MIYSNIHIKKFKGIILTLLIILFFSPTFSQVNYKLVEARKGDGIYVLLRRHGLQPSDYLNKFIALNKSHLGKNNALLTGFKYKLPIVVKTPKTTSVSNAATRLYPIFGDKYKNVPILSSELKGAVYYLIAGHGGPDPGAVGKYGKNTLCEDEYAYDITLRLAKNLIEKGASVYMITRDPNDGIRDSQFLKPDKDEVCYPHQRIPLNQTARLRQRKNAVNTLYSKNKTQFQRMIAVHVDSRSRGQNIDVFFYHDKRSKTGKKAADILFNTFQHKYNANQPGRGYHGTVSSRNLYVVKNTYPVAIYIELGNINHARDQKRFIVTDNRQAVANWLRDGLIKDFKTNK